MGDGKLKGKAAYHPPLPTRPLESSEGWRWPSPTPLPVVPTEDVGRVLKQVLKRLDTIEKRLEIIERIISEKTTL